MGRKRKTSTSSTFSDSQPEESPGTPEETQGERIEKIPLKKLKAEHLEKKKIKEAEERSKTAKQKEVLAEDVERRTEQLGEGFKLLGDAIIEIVCVRLPNPKPPTMMEKQLFSSALGEVANKYTPGLVDYAPEIMLVVSVVAIVLPRLKQDNIPAILAPGQTYKPNLEKQDAGPDLSRAEVPPGDRQDRQREDTPGEAAPGTVAAVGNA